MLMMASIFAIHAASAACPASAGALQADVAVAVRAYDEWAWEAFDQGVASVRADLGCLTEVISGLDAKEAHRLFALAGARGQDEALAVAAFSGLLALEPGYEPDLVLAPRGSLLRRAWERARVEAFHSGQPLPAGSWFVDGEPEASQLPSERAAVVQLADSSGGFLSWYLDGGELPPSLEERLRPVEAVRERAGHRSRGLLVSGLALAAVGVGGLAAGEAFDNQMMDTERESRAQRLYNQGLASTFGGVALGVTGSGLVLGAVFRGQW